MKHLIPKCFLAATLMYSHTGYCDNLRWSDDSDFKAALDSSKNDVIPSLHPMSGNRKMVTGAQVEEIDLKALDFIRKAIGTSQSALGSLARPKMIAFGGGLTAGLTNGGLYREGQLFAYPNLVAIQMGIGDFSTPLFDENERNGTGYMVFSADKNEYPTWKKVNDKLAVIKQGSPPAFSPYRGKVDNWAFPKATLNNLRFAHKIDERNFPRWFEYQPYLWRVLPVEQNEVVSPIDFVKKNQQYDLVIIEDFFDQWITKLLKTERVNLYDFYQSQLVTGQIDLSAATSLIEGGKKAVLFTIPRYQDLAFFNWYPVSAQVDNVSAFVQSYQSEAIQDKTKPKYFVPSEEVDNLFRGSEAKLTDRDVITELEEGLSDPEFAEGHNSQIRQFASKHNLALVDLAKIYAEIHRGSYRTDDGVQITGSLNGNFFSSDGIYPTHLGQVVIANEVIKAINTTYKSQIPLINVSELSKIIDQN